MNTQDSLFKASIIPLLSKAWKIKWILIPLGMLLAAGTWYFTRQQIKIYQASVQVIIDLEAPRYLPYNGSEVVSLGSGKTWNTKELCSTIQRLKAGLYETSAIFLWLC